MLGEDNMAFPELADAFLKSMDSYVPTFPEEATRHFMAQAGAHCDDQRVIRAVSLAAQKFVFDVVSDSLEHCKHKSSSGSTSSKGRRRRKGGDDTYVLTMEDLSSSLSERGIDIVKPEYYLDASNE